MAKKATRYFSKVSANMTVNIQRIIPVIVADMAVKSDNYTPEDTGRTRIEMEVKPNKQQVIWANEYVEYIYWGVHLNFQKTHNPKAQAMWADRAINENVDEWADMLADAIADSF